MRVFLLDALPEASITHCFVLFADPWPKARHAERRFIGPENLPRLARVLRPGGELHLATDDPKLAPWMQEHLEASRAFAPQQTIAPTACWLGFDAMNEKQSRPGASRFIRYTRRSPLPAVRERRGPIA